MNRIKSTVVVLLVLSHVLVNSPFVSCVSASGLWSQTYGGEYDDVARSLVETSDGGFALTGYTRSFGVGESDAWLVKTDSYGNLVWNKTYGGIHKDSVSLLIET